MAAMSAFAVVMVVLLIGLNIAYSVVTRQSQDRILQGIYEYDRKDNERVKRPINEMPWAGGRKNSEFTLRFFAVYCDENDNAVYFRKEYISSIDEETAKEYAAAVLKSGKDTGIYGDYRYLVKSKSDEDDAEADRKKPDQSELPDPPGAEKNGDEPGTNEVKDGSETQTEAGEADSDAANAGTSASDRGDMESEHYAGKISDTQTGDDIASNTDSQSGSPYDCAKKIIFLNIRADVEQQHKLLLLSMLTGLLSLLAVFALVVFFSQRMVQPFARNIKLQKQFITDAGHELKTPITSISTSADIAAMLYEGDEWIRNIQEQSVRLSKLTNDLVMLSRLDEESPLPEKAEFSLTDAAWEIAESFSAGCKAKHLEYEIRIADHLNMTGDRNTIQRMISLLLDNAVRYTPEEGRIRLTVCREKTKMMIEVFNTCVLSDDEDLERLFDRFYRPDKSRSTETGGSGLGLSIARTIARTHGGELSVYSADRRSIVFKALLPPI